MQGSALRNFGTFKQLCGEEFYKNIMLGTTCWDLVNATTIGEERETQLREKGGFWHALLQKGSEIVRIPREQDSARDVIFHLASKDPAFLNSQLEMSTMGLSLDEVSATKTINEELEKVKAANERIRFQEEENFLRLQREREEKARAEQEKARRQHDLMLREQEAERESRKDSITHSFASTTRPFAEPTNTNCSERLLFPIWRFAVTVASY
jgi:hypothetical protein